MEVFIFILLMKYFLCFQIAHLESFSQINSGPNLTSHYLDISEFDQNDVMHLSIIVYSGEMDKIIHYGFSDNTSIKSNLLTYTIDTTSTEHSYSSKNKNHKNSYTTPYNKYYYDIKKVENAKYLLIKCTGYTGTSMEYVFLPMSSTNFYIVFGIIFAICIASIIIYIVCIIRKKRMEDDLLEKKADLQPMVPQDNQPAYSNY